MDVSHVFQIVQTVPNRARRFHNLTYIYFSQSFTHEYEFTTCQTLHKKQYPQI